MAQFLESPTKRNGVLGEYVFPVPLDIICTDGVALHCGCISHNYQQNTVSNPNL